MPRRHLPVTQDLFASIASPPSPAGNVRLGDGAVVLKAFAADEVPALLECVREIAAAAPFRHLITPGGYRMSVAMTNCGQVGWVSDRSGYRYDARDPESGRPWPVMPELFQQLARRASAAAGFTNAVHDCCLINRYEPGSRLSLHQDKDERDPATPIVSVSMGVPATFLFGGLQRSDRPQRVLVGSGDVAVWGGPSRLAYHGVAPLREADHPLTGAHRINLTFRHAL